MSEKMTRIRLRSPKRGGLMDWGEHSFEYMVEQLRSKARRDFEEAQMILQAADADFEVDLVRGPYVQHFIRHIEPKGEALCLKPPR